jgi:hypothetical protein
MIRHLDLRGHHDWPEKRRYGKLTIPGSRPITAHSEAAPMTDTLERRRQGPDRAAPNPPSDPSAPDVLRVLSRSHVLRRILGMRDPQAAPAARRDPRSTFARRTENRGIYRARDRTACDGLAVSSNVPGLSLWISTVTRGARRGRPEHARFAEAPGLHPSRRSENPHNS